MSDLNDHLEKGAGASAPEAPREPEVREDTGTQALSDALRSSFVIVKIIMIILVAVFLGSGVFTVPSQQHAIKLRFGKPVGAGEKMLLEPGLHWSFPYPIDDKVFIPMAQQTVKSSVGWYAVTPEQEAAKDEPYAGPSLNPAVDGYAITADANIIHARATLNYRITDPLKYAMNFVTASNLVQNALDNAIVFAAARTKVDDALRLDRIGFQERVLNRTRELTEKYGLGITFDASTLTLEGIPPRYLKEQFEAVNSADAERRKMIDKAQGDASRIRSAAQSDSSEIVNSGTIDATRLVESVRSEADYFLNQLPLYDRNPGLFMARLQVDSLARALTNAVDKEFNGTGRPMRLLLNREPEKPPQQNTQP
jgi:membrane protease subunit HflK